MPGAIRVPVEAAARPQTYGVLAADDDVGVRGLLRVALRQRGLALWLAADGTEALELYERHRGAIDVVLLDVHMPRLDGPHTLAALQQLNPRICCCCMSGDLGCYSEAHLHSLGAAAFFPKPFRAHEVANALWGLARDGGDARLALEHASHSPDARALRKDRGQLRGTNTISPPGTMQ